VEPEQGEDGAFSCGQSRCSTAIAANATAPSFAAPPAGYVLEVMLPGEVEPDSVEASLDDGVLTIRVAKPEAERGGQRRIAIEGYA
jgi:hypothetical protein